MYHCHGCPPSGLPLNTVSICLVKLLMNAGFQPIAYVYAHDMCDVWFKDLLIVIIIIPL